jgi:hypothetical protein
MVVLVDDSKIGTIAAIKLQDIIVQQLCSNNYNIVGAFLYYKDNLNISPIEFEQIAKRDGCESLLIVKFGRAFVEVVHTPGYATTLWGRRGAFTVYSRGNQMVLPRVKYFISLVSLQDRKTIWICETFTQGGAGVTMETIFNSIAAAVADKLKADFP